MMDLVGLIMKYEQGDASAEEIVTLFEHLIETGKAWSLQGHYGRVASTFIEQGLIDQDGNRTAQAIERITGFAS